MPWDSTTVRVAPLGPDGLGEVETVAGGPGESAVQPRWQGADLLFASDRTGWWNLYAWSAAAGPPSAPCTRRRPSSPSRSGCWA